jgi:hypothetical protein
VCPQTAGGLQQRKRGATTVEKLASSILTGTKSGGTKQLARFFPETQSVQVRAILTPLRSGSRTVCESVLVEFASEEKAIFSSNLPLEFNDRVRLENPEDQGQSEATVVAVQYHEGQMAVAVQFVNGQCAWVKRP